MGASPLDEPQSVDEKHITGAASSGSLPLDPDPPNAMSCVSGPAWVMNNKLVHESSNHF